VSTSSVLNDISNVEAAPDGEDRSPGERVVSRLRASAQWLLDQSSQQSVKMRIGLGIVGFFVLVALLGPLVIHGDPTTFSADQ
jgi:hypothetical protein